MLEQLSVEQAVAAIRDGSVVVVPTETAYALAVDATNKAAVQKLYTIKNRPDSKPIFVMVDSIEMAEQYGDFSDKAKQLAEHYWPGPLTIIVSKRNNPPHPSLDAREGGFLLAPNLNTLDNTIGIRWTSNPIAQQIIAKLGKPITATSANVSGEDSCYTVAEIKKEFPEAKDVAGIVEGGNLQQGELSTLVKCINEKVEVLRKGKIKL
ncbi:MAG: threonylcarbamoyl-AMP synthase [Candidatus Jacksonbacteria bacterium]|nr:threonylcarbamoyl-AMP synthase [Candidatus Jacksonbacteria bacterium]MBT7008740.1 threonylcarbamoyl-AMP synthase [Candidatus Jacksonbacteria bacterium]MBT7339170.1 threonylcarbamoyl-AMP synthase [Candidatus Jacksonbacteria bacterium]